MLSTTKILLSFEPGDFPDFFEGWGDDQFGIAMRDGIRNGIARALSNTFGEQLSRVRIADHMQVSCQKAGISQGLSIKQIMKLGSFSASSIKAEFDLPKDTPLDSLKFECAGGAKFTHWLPDFDVSPLIKIKPMKRWNRAIVRFHQINIPATTLPISEDVVELCKCHGETLKPVNGPMLHFECFVCAKRYICECFRGIPERLSARENYDTRPYLELLNSTPYRADTCHLCRRVPSTTGNRQQGQSEVRAYYWRYIADFAIGKGIGWREAENYIRDRLGVPRIGEGWLAEANLLSIVQALYPELEVLHQASPDWLGRQRFDIFIPDLGLAIEYNGQQHYYPIERFGGQRGFEATQQRDQDKRDKAREAGVTIIEFRYDEDISPERVLQRIRDCLAT